MNKKRTDTDFSKHEIIYKEDSFTKVWDFKRPESNTFRVTFINSFGIMAVTGDVGNWIFCREFHPSKDGSVSDHYWCEKLQIASKQTYGQFSEEQTSKELNEAIKELKSVPCESNLELVKYYEHCKDYVECGEHEYMTEAISELPGWTDHESIIEGRKPYIWLEIVFDAFDEICNRMRDK